MSEKPEKERTVSERCYHCGAVIGSKGRPCAVHNPSEADRKSGSEGEHSG